MKTEDSYQVQLLGYPYYFLRAIKDNKDWNIVNTSVRPDYNQTYDVQYKGKHVLYLYREYGFGWGCNACYPTLSISVIKLLRTVIPNHINIWKHEKSSIVLEENSYTE